MSHYYDRYQRGQYQEVYDELFSLGEAVFDEPICWDALAVARAMIKRVRYNLEELLIPRLKQLGYQFGAGFLEYSDHPTEEEQAEIQRAFPLFQSALPDATEQIAALEHVVGSIPLTLKAWYEEIHTVNLVGAFPRSCPQVINGCVLKRGYALNPFCMYPPDVTRHFLEMEEENGAEERALSLSWDQDSKYGYQGGWDYAILEPFNVFDGTTSLEQNTITFVHYLHLTLYILGGENQA